MDGELFSIFFISETSRDIKVTNMRPELQSQNCVYVNCEKTTGPIYLKFWHKFLIQSTIEIQK